MRKWSDGPGHSLCTTQTHSISNESQSTRRRIVLSASKLLNSSLYNRTSYPFDTHLPFGNLGTFPEGGVTGVGLSLRAQNNLLNFIL